MSPKQFMDLLKNLQKIMKCPSCGAVYQIEEIQYLGQIDGLFLLQLSCQSCRLPVWMNFMVSKDNKIKKPLVFSELGKEAALGKGEITTDEVLSFHKFLKEFNGDFKKALL